MRFIYRDWMIAQLQELFFCQPSDEDIWHGPLACEDDARAYVDEYADN